ncbi:MAG: stalk domain-containing protein [Anaerovoracaceae bacterium]|jgi:uncharacterized membrane protein YkoI
MKIKLFILLLSLGLLIAFVPVKANTLEGLTLWVDGKYLETDVHPFIEDSRTLVPIRSVAEALGFDVDWERATKTVTIDDGINRITMQIDKQYAYHNGKKIRLHKTPMVRDGRTFIPIRDVAETLGKKVDWDVENRTVVIGKGYQGTVQAKKSPISAEEAKEIALNYVNGKIVDFESDLYKYEIEIIKNGYKYELEIAKEDGAIIEIEVEYKPEDIDANGRKPIGKDKAIRIAQSIAPGKVIDFEFEKGKYEIEIVRDGFKYEIEINAYNGNLLEYERKAIKR